MKNYNQLKIGTVLSYVQIFLSTLIGIVYTPIMLRFLGQSEYGLYSTVSSTISMLSVLSLGFISAYIRYYSKYKALDDDDGISRLNGLYLIIFIIIGVIALICGLYLSFHLDAVFDKGLTADEYAIAKILMLLLTINLAISFPMSVFQNIISAHEKYAFLKTLAIFKTVFGPLVTLPLLLIGYRSVAMVSVTLITSLITDVVHLIYVFKFLNVKFEFRNFERGIFKSLFIYTFFIALNSIVDQVNNNLDKFFLGRYKGTVSVAIYSIGGSLYSYYIMFSTSVSSVFTPRIHRIINKTEQYKNQRNIEISELFTKVGRIQFIVLSLVASGLIFFGKTFINYWAGDGYDESYYVAVLLIIPATIPLIQNLGIEIQRALNLHQIRSIFYTLMAVVNSVLTYFLCQKYGAAGAAFGTAVSLILMNGIFMNIYYGLKCGINIIAFWKSILRLSVGLIIPCIFEITALRFFEISSIWKMFAAIIIYTAVYCVSMWFLGMNDYEKNLLKKPLAKVFKPQKRTDSEK